MTQTLSFHRKAAHIARLKYKVIKEWRNGDTIYFEVSVNPDN